MLAHACVIVCGEMQRFVLEPAPSISGLVDNGSVCCCDYARTETSLAYIHRGEEPTREKKNQKNGKNGYVGFITPWEVATGAGRLCSYSCN